MGGVATQLTLVPSERLAVVVLANVTSSVLPAQVRIETLAALLPAYAARKDEVLAALARGALPPGDEPDDAVWSSIAGSWDGTVEAHTGDLRVSMEVDAAARIAIARVGRQPRVVLDRLRVDDGRLQGIMAGTIATPDTARYPHGLVADLRVRGDVLDGALIAVALPGSLAEGGAPGRRAGCALAHRVRLERVR
jgi:hypothetical protein